MSERWYQTEAADAALNAISQGRLAPLILMPTGSGKSWIIAGILNRIYRHYPGQRWLMVTLAKELVAQNAEKLKALMPHAPLGICCASLNKFETHAPIVFGTVGSLASRFEKLGPRHGIIIDEADLVSPDVKTMARGLLEKFRASNPYIPIIGLTATGWRTKLGVLTNEGGIFDNVAYDMTKREQYNSLVRDGYLAPLVTKATHTFVDASNIKVQGGEFVTRSAAELLRKQELIEDVIREVLDSASNYTTWLGYVPDIENVDFVSELLQAQGVAAAGLHSQLPTKQQNDIIAAYKAGDLQCLVVADKLNVGFDHPPIDLIFCLRPTLSSRWWIQATGRGSRPSPETGKSHCLVLDFTGNTRRVGPVNDPYIPKKSSNKAGEAPIRICPGCGVYNHAAATVCYNCGEEFPHKLVLSEKPDDAPIVVTDEPVYEWFDVQRIMYSVHEKIGSPPSMLVMYWCGLRQFKEWVAFENERARGLAARWWRKRCSTTDVPTSTAAALAQRACLRQPVRVYVRTDRKYPEIVGYDFTENDAGTGGIDRTQHDGTFARSSA